MFKNNNIGLLSLAGLVGLVIFTSTSPESPRTSNIKPCYNPTVLEEDSKLLGKTSVVFQKLKQTGENEYIGSVNGRNYVYRFNTEENKVELYLMEKRKSDK